MSKIFTAFLILVPVLCFVVYFKGPFNRVSNHKTDIKLVLPSSPMDAALQQENVVPVVIIGSGPAGLSAALYVARAGMKAFVFAGPLPCGQLTQTSYVENWPGKERVLGAELMNDMKKQVVSFGATIIYDTIIDIDFSKWPFVLKTEDGRAFKAMSLIIATGAAPKTLGIPGEKEFWGKGVTTCAICDAHFFKNKEVVIVGGGDSAAEMVFELSPYVKKVTMLVRKDSLKAAVAIQNRILACPNAVIEYHKELKAIYGNAQYCPTHEDNTCGCCSGEVAAIDVYDNQTNLTERRPIDGVFLSIGHDPNNKILNGAIDLDEHGCMIMKGRTQESSMLGVFAAGEIQDPYYRQAVVAAGEGAKAALDATSFLYSIGFNVSIGAKLDKQFFENFSDEKVELQEISQMNELEEIVNNNPDKLILLDFYSTNCPGCIRMIPVLEAIAYKLHQQIMILKTNYDDVADKESPQHLDSIFRKLWLGNSSFATEEIKVRRLPSLLVFKNGKYVTMTSKLMNKPELLEYVQKFL